MDAGKARRIAVCILDEFGELLDARNMTVPSNDREKAWLYGAE